MEDLNVGLLHLIIVKALESIKAGDVTEGEIILENARDILETYLNS